MMNRKHRAAACPRLLAAALAFAALPAAAQTYSQTVFFGDSLTDSGFYRPFLIQAPVRRPRSSGRFTTNPGLVWAEYLADFYGTNAPAWRDDQASGTAQLRRRRRDHRPGRASAGAADAVRAVADHAGQRLPRRQRRPRRPECAVHRLGRRQRPVLPSQWRDHAGAVPRRGRRAGRPGRHAEERRRALRPGADACPTSA